MREHCYKGYEIVKKIPFLQDACDIIYSHQEHFDGTGYPRGLKGKEIPLGARIFAVADTLDAITSDRPYRSRQSDAAARKEIEDWSGRQQFDPEVVQVFLQAMHRRIFGKTSANRSATRLNTSPIPAAAKPGTSSRRVNTPESGVCGGARSARPGSNFARFPIQPFTTSHSAGVSMIVWSSGIRFPRGQSSVDWFRNSLPSLLLVLVALTLGSSRLAGQDTATAPQTALNVVPQGTAFLIQLTDQLDTRRARRGDHFRATLAEDLAAANDSTLAPGRKIKGHVSAVEPGLHTRLLLSFDEIETDHGWLPLIATVTGVPGEHGLKQLGERKAKSNARHDQRRDSRSCRNRCRCMRAPPRRRALGRKTWRCKRRRIGRCQQRSWPRFRSRTRPHISEKGTALELRLDRNLPLRSR